MGFVKKNGSVSPEKNNNEFIKNLGTTAVTASAIYGAPNTSSATDGSTATTTAKDESTVNTEQLPLLVLVNPNSGQGKAQHLWEREAGLLEEAGLGYMECNGLTCQTIVTSHKNEARDIMKEADLAKWRGVVVVSGDGLVHEVYNGLYARKDWTTSREFPVGVVPAGSGNALFRSIIHRLEEDSAVIKKDSAVLKDTRVPQEEGTSVPDNGLKSSLTSAGGSNLASMDLMMVKTDDGDRLGFLSVGWGLISDVDIDSEAIRWTGSLRFTIYGLLYILRKRVYRATLSYIASGSDSLSRKASSSQISTPADKDKDFADKEAAWVTETSDYLCIYVMNLPYLDQATKLAPGAEMDDGLLWLVIIRSHCTRAGLLNFMRSMENGTHTDLPGIDYFPVAAVSIQPSKEGPQAKMTIDGELITTGTVQVHSLSKAGTIMLNLNLSK